MASNIGGIVILIRIDIIRFVTKASNLKGGEKMELAISFIISVVASVVAYYICKWLDGNM